jgi:hypothetical protein
VAACKMRRCQCWQYGYMGAAPSRYVVTKRFAPFFLETSLLSYSLLSSPPCGTVRAPSLAPAPTTRPEAKSSSPWVVYLSISVTGICDGSFIKGAAEFPFFSTHPSNYCLVRMDFGSCSKK